MRTTLLADGPSDRALLPILTWVLKEAGLPAVQPVLADLRVLPSQPKTLEDRARAAVLWFPCDLLFVHRDAERRPSGERRAEVEEAVRPLGVAFVAVVPVRMTEAWLLLEEAAIRRAAGNPAGRVALKLPEVRELESLPEPKDVLYGLLREASGFSGRRLANFRPTQAVNHLSQEIKDHAPLRKLEAFKTLESDLRRFVQTRAGS